VSSSFWDYFNNFTEIYNYAIPLNLVHMGKATFDTLSADQQRAVLEAAAETRDLNWAAVPGRLKNTFAQLAENKVKVITSTDEAYRKDLQRAGKAALDDWLKNTGDTGRDIIAEFNKRMGR